VWHHEVVGATYSVACCNISFIDSPAGGLGNSLVQLADPFAHPWLGDLVIGAYPLEGFALGQRVGFRRGLLHF
jgi:hypothetical protein